MRFGSIVASALVVDTATAALLQLSGAGGERVREWYRTLKVGAFAMDVLSLIIGAYVAFRVAPDTLWAQLGAVVAVQMLHDFAFGIFVSSKASGGPLMNLFRRYANEMGMNILWADAAMMICTVLVARLISNLSSDATAALGSVAAYVGMLVVYSF